MRRILVVDDKVELGEYFAWAAKNIPDCEVCTTSTCSEAIRLLKSKIFDVVVTDLGIQGKRDGLEVLKAAREQDSLVQVIVVTAYGTPELSVEVMSLGAFDYFTRVSSAIDFFKYMQFKIDLALRHREALVFMRGHHESTTANRRNELL